MKDIERNCNELVEWLQLKVAEASGKGVVFGLSGGVDSAVVAGVCKQAFPETSLGVIMPCNSNPIDEKHALLVAKSLNLRTKKVDLSETYNIFAKTLGIEDVKDMAAANIKPRLRMTTLYYLAQRNNYLVLGCSNKSEFSIGYFTKYGDSGADLLPIASIVKRDIWKMAEHLNIPKEIIEKTPTAGLWEDQTDEEEMGFGYDVLDTFILEGTGPDEITGKIERMQRISEHKRKFPPIFTPKD